MPSFFAPGNNEKRGGNEGDDLRARGYDCNTGGAGALSRGVGDGLRPCLALSLCHV